MVSRPVDRENAKVSVVYAESRRHLPPARRKGELSAPVLRNRTAGRLLVNRCARHLPAPHALQGDAVLSLRARKQKALRAEFRRERYHVLRGREVSVLDLPIHASALSHAAPGEVETDIYRQRLRCRQFSLQILPEDRALFHIAREEMKALPHERQRCPPRLIPERREHFMSRVEQLFCECKPQKAARTA